MLVLYYSTIGMSYSETDFFTSIGGPHPYHDTYTFSFYMNDYDRESMQNVLWECCRMQNAFVRDIYTGHREPSFSLIDKIQDFLKR